MTSAEHKRHMEESNFNNVVFSSIFQCLVSHNGDFPLGMDCYVTVVNKTKYMRHRPAAPFFISFVSSLRKMRHYPALLGTPRCFSSK